MVNEPEMLLLTTCVLCSGILLSVCVFEIALGFCRPTHGFSGPTNGRRATLPNTNPSWDGFFPAHPLMLGADQREAVVGRIIAACSGIWPTAPVWPSACAVPLRCRCVLWTAVPADPP